MHKKKKWEKTLTGSRIAADGEVTSWVNPVGGLHVVLECRDTSRTCDECCDLGRRGVALGQIVGDISLDATRIVAVAVGSWVLGRCCVSQGGKGSSHSISCVD